MRVLVLVLLRPGVVRLQVVVFMNKVRLLGVAVHLQPQLVVRVFELRRGDEVVLLHVRHVVHRLRFLSFPPPLPVNVPQRQTHHAEEHQQRHQPDGEGNRGPLESSLIGGRSQRGEVLTARPSDSGGTDAGGWGVGVFVFVGADSSVQTGGQGALVQDALAVAPGEAGGAEAAVVADAVLTRAAVQAGSAGALVDVDLAADANEAGAAAAHAHAAVDQALATVVAGQRGALVDLLLTVEAGVAARTVAPVAPPPVALRAAAAVETGRVGARQQAVLAVGAFETRRTGALVAPLQVRAGGSVATGPAVTLLHEQLTVGASEAWEAGAGVAALPCVHAGGAVLTRLVVGAEVQVLVAEQAAPALLTVALPGQLAGAVFTGWVFLTLVTERTLPAVSADTLSGT